MPSLAFKFPPIAAPQRVSNPIRGNPSSRPQTSPSVEVSSTVLAMDTVQASNPPIVSHTPSTPPSLRRAPASMLNSSPTPSPEYPKLTSWSPTTKRPRGNTPESTKIYATPPISHPRESSARRQRSKSALLFLSDPNTPSYAMPTELSALRARPRVRAASFSGSDFMISSNESGPKPNPPPASDIPTPEANALDNEVNASQVQLVSGFILTITSSTDLNTLRINPEPNFRLEIRMRGANAIEIASIPIALEQTPTCPVAESRSTPRLPPTLPREIPELPENVNIGVPVELESEASPTSLTLIPALPEIIMEEEVETATPEIIMEEEVETATPETIVEEEVEIAPPPPKNAQEHLNAVMEFVQKRRLGNFFPAAASDGTEGLLEKLSNRAASLVNELEDGNDTQESNSFLADAATVAKVVKLALYDHVIFCDDSGSMQMGNRIETLKATLNSITRIAIALDEPSGERRGISMRFINSKHDSNMDNITSMAQIEAAMRDVDFTGETKIGKKLKRKVLRPFIEDRLEMQGKRLERPLLITIITDGEPSEDRNLLKDTILNCKRYMERKGYGSWAVGFHIAQIGESRSAEFFLREIQEDEEVREHVHVTKEKVLDAGTDCWATPEKEYDLWWVSSLLKAIEH